MIFFFRVTGRLGGTNLKDNKQTRLIRFGWVGLGSNEEINGELMK